MGGDSKHLTKHLNLSILHRNTTAQQIVVTLIMSVHPTCLMVSKSFPGGGVEWVLQYTKVPQVCVCVQIETFPNEPTCLKSFKPFSKPGLN